MVPLPHYKITPLQGLDVESGRIRANFQSVLLRLWPLLDSNIKKVLRVMFNVITWGALNILMVMQSQKKTRPRYCDWPDPTFTTLQLNSIYPSTSSFRTPHPQSATQTLHNSSQAERHFCVTNRLNFVSKNWCAFLFTLPTHHPENHTLTSIDLIQRTSWKVRGRLGSTPFLCNTQNIERASSDGPWSWLPNKPFNTN